MKGLRQPGRVALLTGFFIVGSLASVWSSGVMQPPEEQTLTLEDLAQLDALLEDDAQTTGPIFDR